MSGYWEPIEGQWQAKHLEALQPLLSLAGEAHELVAYIATHSEVIETLQSEKLMVERLLALRLGEELRAVELLARVGHASEVTPDSRLMVTTFRRSGGNMVLRIPSGP